MSDNSKIEFITQFGEKFLNPSDGGSTLAPSDAFCGKEFIMLYFSAHWCPPCRQFTPKLIDFYKKMKTDGKNYELLFCSLDRDEKEYNDYTSDMPWLCMPFKAEETKALAQKYKAQGIPHLVVVDGTSGEVITLDGTGEMREDSEGANFPWKPKSFKELLPDQILASKQAASNENDEMAVLDSSLIKEKYLMLYFSAHWCPPCRGFTPILSKAYTSLKAERDDFELVFVSSDRDEDSFKSYFDEMTFCALPYKYREVKNALTKKFGVRGIPKLVILGPEDQESGERPLINDNIRSVIESGDFSEFPFHKKKYGDLNHASINELKSLIIFHENGDDEEQEDVKKVAKEAAEKIKDANGGNKDVVFLWALDGKGMGPRVRSALELPESSADPVMVILDIPDNGGYYKSDSKEMSVEAVMKFVENPGKRFQL